MTAATWKRAAKRWRARARRGNAQHEHYIVCADAERRQLTARAEAAEAARAAVPVEAIRLILRIAIDAYDMPSDRPHVHLVQKWLADAAQPEVQP